MWAPRSRAGVRRLIDTREAVGVEEGGVASPPTHPSSFAVPAAGILRTRRHTLHLDSPRRGRIKEG